MLARRLRCAAAPLLGLVALGLVATPPASAQIVESREGDANPMVAVFKSTLYGAGAGLVLGLAVELVANDADGEAAKWGFVGGTFFGFAYGLYHVSTRPEPGRALLEGGSGGWAFALPSPEVELERSNPRAPFRDRNLEIRASLAALRF